ncbi:MAG: xanthine dehydrogenase FAD-binding subunit XdhB [Clostridium sp.]
MFDIKNIIEPETLEEAIKLKGEKPELKVIAGGTDVLIKLRHGSLEGVELLSIKNLKELDFIKEHEERTIEIGAMSCFAKVHRSKLIEENLTALAEGAVSMGGPQIRNMATIGGNVCNGAVSADSVPSLFAFNAKIKLVSSKGERIVPITEFYEGPGKVKINEDELLVSILIDKKDYEGAKSNYIKYSNRKAMDISMLGVAAVAKVKDGKFEEVRIALGVAAPVPVRCLKAEAFALGKAATEETIKTIGEEAVKAAKARDSWRASKAYREHLIEELTVRALRKIVEESGE